ncbi:alpha/beta family hydrolase [Kordiimonas aestuarii]|uniref:alpha/beta family hydrolase n=1 Tax=Kordiimonas aestuarii TaxID=1005925 RepID=UPI0021D17E9A|nr:alpha/beta family hydrolase [Kordiimonas aestuarii]
MMTDFIENGTGEKGTVLLAHGAGAGMDSDFMVAWAEGLACRGFRTLRFEFPYMVLRREDGKKRPPDRAPKLMEAYHHAITETHVRYSPHKLIIGGKSMGARIASMVAAEDPTLCDGLLLLGYPFHPTGKPENLRTGHLAAIDVPALVIQGERDPFGNKALVDTLDLADNFTLHWASDGNHDLSPRKASGFTAQQNRATALGTAARHFG